MNGWETGILRRNRIMKNLESEKKIIVYGAGKRATCLCSLLQETSYRIVGLTDSNPMLYGKQIGNLEIKSVDEAFANEYDYWVVSIANKAAKKEINCTVLTHGGREGKEIDFEDLLLQIYEEQYVKWKDSRTGEMNLGNPALIFENYNGFILGGVEKWVASVLNAGILEGMNIRVLSSINHTGIKKEWFPYIDFEIPTGTIDRTDQVQRLFCYFERYRTSVFVFSFPNDVFKLACIYKKMSVAPLQIIAVLHNDVETFYQEYIKYDAYVNQYLCVSQRIQYILNHTYNISEQKTQTVTLPFQCEETLERGYSLNVQEPIRIGYAGRLEVQQKRLDLFPAFVFELEKSNLNYKMEIAGDGSARELMQKFVRDNHLENKIIFLGQIDRNDIPTFWRSQDIQISFSDYEGHSITQLESMANGAVPIVTEVSGVVDDITNGYNGFYGPVGDYEFLANQVRYLYWHREQLQVMGQAAHDTVYEKSDMKSHIAFWHTLLEENACN